MSPTELRMKIQAPWDQFESLRVQAIEHSSVGVLGTIYYPTEQALEALYDLY